MNRYFYNGIGINEKMLEDVDAMRHYQCSRRPRSMHGMSEGPFEDSAYPPYIMATLFQEEKTEHGKQSLSLRKENPNIPCSKGQFENLSSSSEYLSNHSSSVLMNSACVTSVRESLEMETAHSVLW